MLCMHARPHRRKDQLPLRSLRDFRSRWVFAPVRPRLARWEYTHPRDADPQIQEMEIQQYIHRKDSKIIECFSQPIESKTLTGTSL